MVVVVVFADSSSDDEGGMQQERPQSEPPFLSCLYYNCFAIASHLTLISPDFFYFFIGHYLIGSA